MRKPKHHFTEEEVAWLVENQDTMSRAKLTEAFNARFGTALNKWSIQDKCDLLGLKRDSYKYHNYTEEQIDWLRERQDTMTRAELAQAFNAHFGASVDRSSISDVCTKQLGLHRSVNVTTFAHKTQRQIPIGEIRKSQTGTYIKVKDVPVAIGKNNGLSGYREPYWTPLQKKIYQDAHGEIGKDQFVIFLDGNTDNFDLDNLYPIDRKISATMSKYGWWSKERESTLAAIKWCELYYATKGANND